MFDAVANPGHAGRGNHSGDCGGACRQRNSRTTERCGASSPSRDTSVGGGAPLCRSYERIKREYVDEVDDHELMEKAVRGMVAALDPHSAFLDSEEFEEIRLSTMGSYPGVGIEVVAEDAG